MSIYFVSVEQLVARGAHVPEVVGSSPPANNFYIFKLFNSILNSSTLTVIEYICFKASGSSSESIILINENLFSIPSSAWCFNSLYAKWLFFLKSSLSLSTHFDCWDLIIKIIYCLVAASSKKPFLKKTVKVYQYFF